MKIYVNFFKWFAAVMELVIIIILTQNLYFLNFKAQNWCYHLSVHFPQLVDFYLEFLFKVKIMILAIISMVLAIIIVKIIIIKVDYINIIVIVMNIC